MSAPPMVNPRLRWETIAVQFAEWLDQGCPRSDPTELLRRLTKVLAEVGEVADQAAEERQDRDAIAGEAADVVFAALVALVSMPAYTPGHPRSAWGSSTPVVPELPQPLAYQPLTVDRQTMRLTGAAGRLAETIAGNQRKGTQFRLEDAQTNLDKVIAVALSLIARTGLQPAEVLDRCAAKLANRMLHRPTPQK